ncbi:hypothetical protein BJF78_21760 [Pseudonocardia sp. CNS-139]|nr:hypothetical protein BJF78_21760 [Pseudonocardia sp. CNS-139]
MCPALPIVRSSAGPAAASATRSACPAGGATVSLPAAMCSTGTVTAAAASIADGRVWAIAIVTTAATRGWPTAATSAVPPPIPWPASAVRRESTLIRPSPSRTPAHTSRVVRRSAANPAWLGSTPRWLAGAAATMPHEARCRSRSA